MINLDDSQPGTSTERMNSAPRRSSNRSIKRKKFFDELVKYNLGLPSRSKVKDDRTRTNCVSSVHPERAVLVKPPLSSTVSAPTTPATEMKFATKDLGRWKATDDLALIIGIQQTNDLELVHLGTKFSCKFTVQELEQRWSALLYDQAVSGVAAAAMRNLHPDMIAAIESRALWSTQEEQLLGTIKSRPKPTLNTFADLLSQHSDVFFRSRTAVALQHHWRRMRLYYLLPDQASSLLIQNKPMLDFSDAEDLIDDVELEEQSPDESLDQEMHLQHRQNVHETRQLENEMAKYAVLTDRVRKIARTIDMRTYAVLRAPHIRYKLRCREVIIGRSGKNHSVDLDLSLAGPADKISRRQATLRLLDTGEFYLYSEGKRPVFVDGKPILAGDKACLYDNSVVEFASIRLVFNVNQYITKVIRTERVPYNIPF